ncbi:hypothetical protein [Gimesia algae]|uniref:Uncharacterized protein n=1 Tax=Gimesia algae TaxID=2527971 RepID=A0A517VGG7_9PLAN|nr:hypothetical protein [Gimesia algae]QDT92100.1 hypothetical protein Pan161_37650 [Gimesia algae]
MVKRIQLPTVLGIVLLLCGTSIAPVNGTPKKSVMTTLSLKSDAPQVELFEGIEKQQLGARVYPMSAYSSSVYISNLTTAPLTVKVPAAVSSVHILAQAGPNPGLLQGLQGGQQTQVGDSQAVGGNLNPVGNNQKIDFNGLFTIPPEKTVKLKLSSVCLEHGKPCPSSLKTYELRPIESQVQDQALVLVLQKFNPKHDDLEMVQAIAWHLSSHLGWQELASKKKHQIVGGGVPFFTPAQLIAAKKVVEVARIESHKLAAQKAKSFPDSNVNSDTRPVLSRVRQGRR